MFSATDAWYRVRLKVPDASGRSRSPGRGFAECSARAARRTAVDHRRTLRQGMEQTRLLIGLDLSRHSGRVRADLALRLLESPRSPANRGPEGADRSTPPRLGS